ncbi:hypothetical protein ACFFX0_27420 [Citricoccus parietis]|uniref:Uncharacterized protein n=1 Tax=Citricoccus parietis TaxID=592307 RepID=A0ABV5G7Y6_9MICC
MRAGPHAHRLDRGAGGLHGGVLGLPAGQRHGRGLVGERDDGPVRLRSRRLELSLGGVDDAGGLALGGDQGAGGRIEDDARLPDGRDLWLGHPGEPVDLGGRDLPEAGRVAIRAVVVAFWGAVRVLLASRGLAIPDRLGGAALIGLLAELLVRQRAEALDEVGVQVGHPHRVVAAHGREHPALALVERVRGFGGDGPEVLGGGGVDPALLRVRDGHDVLAVGEGGVGREHRLVGEDEGGRVHGGGGAHLEVAEVDLVRVLRQVELGHGGGHAAVEGLRLVVEVGDLVLCRVDHPHATVIEIDVRGLETRIEDGAGHGHGGDTHERRRLQRALAPGAETCPHVLSPDGEITGRPARQRHSGH